MFEELLENIENKCRVSKNISRTILREDEFDNIILDINSITVVPFLNNSKFTDINNVIITPFIKTIEFILNLKSKIKYKNLILVVDNGITKNAKKLYPNYKGHRKHSSKRLFRLHKDDLYGYNITLIKAFFSNFNGYVDTSPGEADFKIGLLLKEKFSNDKNLVVSSDKDLILTTKYADFLLRRYTKNKGFSYYYFSNDNLFCFSNIEKGLELNSPEEYLLFKALVGDSSDNIKGILTRKKAMNFLDKITNIDKINLNDLSKLAVELNYTKNEEAFKNQLLLNLSIVNIYNDKIFNSVEKKNIIAGINEYLKNKTYNKAEIKKLLDAIIHPALAKKILAYI